MARRPTYTAADIEAWLYSAGNSVDEIGTAITTGVPSDAIGSEALRSAQRRLLIIARNSAQAACELYALISIADSKETMAKLQPPATETP